MPQTPGSVLIVDDDPDFLEQMEMYLESRGYTVFSASNRPDGERLLETVEPGIAVLDLMMENEDDGFVLAHRIRRKYPNIPVILVTAVTHETGLEFDETEDGGNWIKADTILAKPIRFEQLEREIARLLREKA